MKVGRSSSTSNRHIDEQLLSSLKFSREALASKRDIKAYYFKQEQVRMYQKIRDQSPLVNAGQKNYWKVHLSPTTRRLKNIMME